VYYFQNIDINPYITGAVQPKLNQDNLFKIPIYLPPDIERKGVVQILKAFDDKIELNHRMNKTLESIAQAIFKHRFMDFESTGSFDWQVDGLGKHIEFIKGKKPSQISETQSAGYRPQILIDNLNGNPSLYANENGMIVVGIDEPIMVMDGASSGRVEIGHNGVLGSTLAKVIVASDRISNLFLYYFLKTKESDINQNTTGTSIPHTDKERIKKYQCNLPPKKLLETFNNIAAKFLNKIITNKNEIKTLVQIRDSLLSRLMSGRIRVQTGGA
jgi:restriction endonuclease S subunit